jgi:hypothetical protein
MKSKPFIGGIMGKVLLSLLVPVLLTGVTAASAAPIRVQEKIVGIGVVLTKSDETGIVSVDDIIPEAPAAKSGQIHPGMVLDGVFAAP